MFEKVSAAKIDHAELSITATMCAITRVIDQVSSEDDVEKYARKNLPMILLGRDMKLLSSVVECLLKCIFISSLRLQIE